MSDNVQGRRGRGLVVAGLLAVALVIVAWVVRSRREAAADIGTGWPPPRPAGAGAEWLRPEGNDGEPAPQATLPAGRRPSPRPRADQAVTSAPSSSGLPAG